jgi:hypothetical protein
MFWSEIQLCSQESNFVLGSDGAGYVTQLDVYDQ